ncbi:hypothetical protein J1614_005914 [Plenodomus biglobosus]|nr:hypothetical protein J1614_005914 [Plenodomus biglobosus]
MNVVKKTLRKELGIEESTCCHIRRLVMRKLTVYHFTSSQISIPTKDISFSQTSLTMPHAAFCCCLIFDNLVILDDQEQTTVLKILRQHSLDGDMIIAPFCTNLLVMTFVLTSEISKLPNAALPPVEIHSPRGLLMREDHPLVCSMVRTLGSYGW